MAGLFVLSVLFFLFLLVAVMFMHYRYERKNEQTRVSRTGLLLGFDFSKGSPWKSSSMSKETRERLKETSGSLKETRESLKETSESLSEVIGGSPDQDLPDNIMRPRTDEGIEKKDIGTILTKGTGANPLKIVGEPHGQGGLEKIVRPPTDEGIKKEVIGTIVVEEDSPTDEPVEKKEVVAIIVEDDNPTDEDVERDARGKITYMEFQKLLLLADRLSSNPAPRKADYGRGYHLAIQIHFNNAHRGPLPDHHSIAEIARRNRCRNVHAFAHGYRDGFMGLKPEYSDC